MTDEPQAVVTGFLKALEDLDIDRALTFAASDIVYQNVPLPPARGVAAVEKQLRLMARFGSGFEARTHHIASDGNVVLTERTDVLRRGAWEAEFWVCGTFESHLPARARLSAATKGSRLCARPGVRRGRGPEGPRPRLSPAPARTRN
jgi:limonene-1,2-epoxide hydrolase